jgi:hypothetical protein
VAIAFNHRRFMPTRFTVQPDERFAPLRSALGERLDLAAGLLNSDNFSTFLDPLMRHTLLNGFDRAGAGEGTVWLLDSAKVNLVAAFNSGPNAERIVRLYKQPMNSGMIGFVAASEQPICENEVYKSERQDKTLDRKLDVVTSAMIAVPFSFMRRMRGVISCVQLKPKGSANPDPSGFSPENLRTMEFAARLASKLIDLKLLALTLGQEDL